MEDTKNPLLWDYAGLFSTGRCDQKVLYLMLEQILIQRTGQLSRLSQGLNDAVAPSSNFRRLRRYLDRNPIDAAVYIDWVISTFTHSSERLILSLDRTEWRIGSQNVNLLCISLCHEQGALPLVWIDLGQRGGSKVATRITLLDQLLGRLSEQHRKRIWYLCGDREFMGIDWFKGLKSRGISYIMAVRKDIGLLYEGRKARIETFFQNKKYKALPKTGIIFKQPHYVAGYRRKDGTSFLLLSDQPLKHGQTKYRQRWSIEVMFSRFKSRGLNIMHSQIRNHVCLQRLFQVLSLAYCWLFRIALRLRQLRVPNSIERTTTKPVRRFSWFRLALECYLQLRRYAYRKPPDKLYYLNFVHY